MKKVLVCVLFVLVAIKYIDMHHEYYSEYDKTNYTLSDFKTKFHVFDSMYLSKGYMDQFIIEHNNQLFTITDYKYSSYDASLSSAVLCNLPFVADHIYFVDIRDQLYIAYTDHNHLRFIKIIMTNPDIYSYIRQ